MPKFSTQAVHGGYDGLHHRDAVSVPIYQNVAFDLGYRVKDGAYDARSDDEAASHGFTYSRIANPTVDVLERRIADLEHGRHAVAVSSGMAAVSYALLCAAEDGGRILSSSDLYGASVDAMKTFFPKFGISTNFVHDINNLSEVESAIRDDTRAIFAETVSNPSTRITDIRALSDLAHRHGLPLIVDNTVPTPYLCRPIDFGADIVVHSTTKGICGHGNALGGIIVDAGRFDWGSGAYPHFNETELILSDEQNGQWESFASKFSKDAYVQRIRTKYVRTFGAVQSPVNAYLTLLGLETLPQRISQQVASAKAIAEHLVGLPHVLDVQYSGLDGDSQQALAKRYLPHGVGQVLSFLVDGDEDNIRRILGGVRVFSYVPNIGDSRSLIVNPARITHREVPREYRIAAGVSNNLLRLSIGLEDVHDLIADLDQAILGAY